MKPRFSLPNKDLFNIEKIRDELVRVITLIDPPTKEDGNKYGVFWDHFRMIAYLEVQPLYSKFDISFGKPGESVGDVFLWCDAVGDWRRWAEFHLDLKTAGKEKFNKWNKLLGNDIVY